MFQKDVIVGNPTKKFKDGVYVGTLVKFNEPVINDRGGYQNIDFEVKDGDEIKSHTYTLFPNNDYFKRTIRKMFNLDLDNMTGDEVMNFLTGKEFKMNITWNEEYAKYSTDFIVESNVESEDIEV